MNQHIKENPASGGKDAGSVLEFLAERYLEENPVNSERIKAIQAEMDPYYESVSFETSNRLFNLVYDLCLSYEQAAFRAGLQLGLRLREEIS